MTRAATGIAAAALGMLCLLVPLFMAASGAPTRADETPQTLRPAEPEEAGPLVAEGPEPHLVLLYTGGVIGYVEPCGCPHNPSGGLARRAGYIKLLKDKYPGATIALSETGDFSGDATEAGRIKTGNLLDGMSTMGFDALNVGERDLAGGITAFLDRAAKSGLTFTNANFIYRDNGAPLFAPVAVREHAAAGRTIKIGYIGLNAYNSAFAKEGAGGRIVIMREPAEALRQELPALRRRVDLVVVLANLNLRDLAGVLAAAPGVDLVLASFGGRFSPGGALEEVGGVPVLYAGDQGKRIGEVRVTVGAKGTRPEMKAGHVWLTRRYPSEPKLQALIDSTIERVNAANRKAAEKPMAQPAAGRGSPTTGGDPAAVHPAEMEKRFLTSEACQSCHGDAYHIYSGSAHAHAFQTLVTANQDYNPECISCHVTGFNEPEGFINVRLTPHLMNVQCEACHGNGAEHIRDPQKPFGAVPPRKCFACHTKENSPDFVFFKYWDLIKH